MAFKHSKDTVVKLGANDLSAYTNSSTFEKNSDSHDVTTYGKDAHVFQGGLLNGAQGIEGVYDSTAVTGPRAVILPMVGTVVPFIRQPEGAGTGKPQDSFDVLVTKYTETSPVADMIKWAAELQPSDDMDHTAQV